MKDSVILITGGTQGLGKELCRVFSYADRSNKVYAISNNKESLKEIYEELPVEAEFCDISDPHQIDVLVKKVFDQHKKIDCVINNAGIWIGGELESNSYEDIARVLMVNTLGTMYFTKAVIPYMKKQGFGKIINIGSTNGIETKSDRAVYVASKWAITGFTMAMRKELEKYNIAVVGLNPGLMATSLHKNAGAERDYECAMNPDEVAKIVDFVASMNTIVVEQMTFRNLHCEIF